MVQKASAIGWLLQEARMLQQRQLQGMSMLAGAESSASCAWVSGSSSSSLGRKQSTCKSTPAAAFLAYEPWGLGSGQAQASLLAARPQAWTALTTVAVPQGFHMWSSQAASGADTVEQIEDAAEEKVRGTRLSSSTASSSTSSGTDPSAPATAAGGARATDASPRGTGQHSPLSTAQLSRLISMLSVLPEAERFLAVHGPDLRPTHVAQLTARLPALQPGVAANARRRLINLMRVLGGGLQRCSQQLTGPELAATLAGLAHLRYSPHGCGPALAHELFVARGGPKLRGCSVGQASGAAWAVASLKVMYGPSLGEPLPTGDQGQDGLAAWRGQGAAHGGGAGGVAGGAQGVPFLDEPRAWANLVKAVQPRLEEATGEDLSQLAWALAKARHPDTLFFASVARSMLRLCPPPPPRGGLASDLSPHTNAVLGAHLSFKERRQLLKLRQQTAPAVAMLPPPQPAQGQGGAGAPPSRGTPSDPMSAFLPASSADASMEGGPVLALPGATSGSANTGSAVTALGGLSQGLLERQNSEDLERALALYGLSGSAARRAAKSMPSSTAIVNTVWAFTACGLRSPKLFAGLARAAVLQQADLDLTGVATLLWGFAAFGFHDPPLVTALSQRAGRDTAHMSAEQLSQVFWALGTLRHHEPSLWSQLPRVLSQMGCGTLAVTGGGPGNSKAGGGRSTSVTAGPGEGSEPELGPKHAVNILWALAVMPEDPRPGSGPGLLASSGTGSSTGSTSSSKAGADPPLDSGLPKKQPLPKELKQRNLAVQLLIRRLLHEQAVTALQPKEVARALWATAVLALQPAAPRELVTDLAPALIDRLSQLSQLAGTLPASQLAELHLAGLALGTCSGLSSSSRRMLAARGGDSEEDEDEGEEGDSLWGDGEGEEEDEGEAEDGDEPTGAAAEDVGTAASQPLERTPADAATAAQGSPAPATPATAVPAADPTGDPHEILDLSHIPPEDPDAVLPVEWVSVLPPAWADAAQAAATRQVVEAVVPGASEGAGSPDEASASSSHDQEEGRSGGGSGNAEKVGDTKRSPWKEEVQQVLQDMGLILVEGVGALPGPSLAVDLAAVDSAGERVAVIRAGRGHYCRSVPFHLQGNHQLQVALLREDGWKVVVVPWFEWALQTSPEQQLMYMYERLMGEGGVL